MPKQISQTDIAYLAGLFDGEGCVTCKQRKTKRKDRGGKVYKQWYIRCEINMADKADSMDSRYLGLRLELRKKVLQTTCAS